MKANFDDALVHPDDFDITAIRLDAWTNEIDNSSNALEEFV